MSMYFIYHPGPRSQELVQKFQIALQFLYARQKWRNWIPRWKIRRGNREEHANEFTWRDL